MKAVIISVRPPWCQKIASREKGCEIRKTRPKIDIPFKCYIYCTYGEGLIFRYDEVYPNSLIGVRVSQKATYGNCVNGKIMGEFVCDRIDEYTNYSLDEQAGHIKRREDLLRSACMTMKDWRDYIGSYRSDVGYAWNISELVIYDKPKELSEFFVKCNENCEDCDLWKSVRVNADEFDMDCSSPIYGYKPLKLPPQSWFYVEAI